MGRPKKTPTITTSGEEISVGKTNEDRVIAEIHKKFGKGLVVSGQAILNDEKVLIPLSPSMDFGHGGGLQEGSFVIFAGQPRVGKTTASLHFAANAQQEEYGSRQVVYLNAEARLEKRDLIGIPKLKTDSPWFHLVQASAPTENPDGTVEPGKILTAKDFLGIAERFLLHTTKKIFILDSISVMIGDTEWVEGLDSVAIGEAQRLFSKFTRRMSQVIATNRHVFIGIVHLYANLGGHGPMQGPKWLEKMSNSAQYGLASKFRATKVEPWMGGKKQIGQIVEWRCDRSPLGPPGVEIKGYIRYGQGIDELQEYIDFAIQVNLIKPTGEKSSWYSLEFVIDDEKPLIQGKEQINQYLREHPELMDILTKKVREGLGI